MNNETEHKSIMDNNEIESSRTQPAGKVCDTNPSGPSKSITIHLPETESQFKASPVVKAIKTETLGQLNNELKSALDTWSELSVKLAGKVSPEEEQLQEIKVLLGDLKKKLKEFS